MKLIGVFSKNRCEWFIFDWACMLLGLTSVPLYDTLGIENLTYCLKQTEMTTILVSSDTLKTFLDLKDIGKVKTIISFDPVDEKIAQQLKARGLTFLYYSEMVKEG
jgi:long-chain acyl-CoA synthetase